MIIAAYIGPKIAPDDRPRITARVKVVWAEWLVNIKSMNLKFVKNLYIKHLGMIIILLRKDMILEIYAITVYGFL